VFWLLVWLLVWLLIGVSCLRRGRRGSRWRKVLQVPATVIASGAEASCVGFLRPVSAPIRYGLHLTRGVSPGSGGRKATWAVRPGQDGWGPRRPAGHGGAFGLRHGVRSNPDEVHPRSGWQRKDGVSASRSDVKTEAPWPGGRDTRVSAVSDGSVLPFSSGEREIFALTAHAVRALNIFWDVFPVLRRRPARCFRLPRRAALLRRRPLSTLDISSAPAALWPSFTHQGQLGHPVAGRDFAGTTTSCWDARCAGSCSTGATAAPPLPERSPISRGRTWEPCWARPLTFPHSSSCNTSPIRDCSHQNPGVSETGRGVVVGRRWQQGSGQLAVWRS
jgi:hypothetical protein